MTQKNHPNIVLGTPEPFFNDDLDLHYGQQFLDVFKSRGYFDFDTGRNYLAAEKALIILTNLILLTFFYFFKLRNILLIIKKNRM